MFDKDTFKINLVTNVIHICLKGVMMGGTITFEAHLPVKIKKKGKWFIAYCNVLDVVTQGETEKKAKSNLVDAIEGFLSTCFDMGTLDAVLKECGFTLQQPKRKQKPLKNELSVTVPLYLLGGHQGRGICPV